MDFCFSFSSCDGSHKTLTSEKKAMGLNTEPTNLLFMFLARFLLGCSLAFALAVYVGRLLLSFGAYVYV